MFTRSVSPDGEMLKCSLTCCVCLGKLRNIFAILLVRVFVLLFFCMQLLPFSHMKVSRGQPVRHHWNFNPCNSQPSAWGHKSKHKRNSSAKKKFFFSDELFWFASSKELSFISLFLSSFWECCWAPQLYIKELPKSLTTWIDIHYIRVSWSVLCFDFQTSMSAV